MSLSSSTIGGKIKYKIVLLGDQAVGKSSMIEKYIYDKFDQTGNPTVGIDFLVKNVIYRNKTYRLQLWDTAGQERFRSLIPTYLKDANCAIIVFDVSSRSSLNNAEKWLHMFQQYKSQAQTAILVANKIDLSHRLVTRQEGQSKAKELKTEYMEVSAKTGKKLEQLFEHVIDMVADNLQNGVPDAIYEDKNEDDQSKKFENSNTQKKKDYENQKKQPQQNTVLKNPTDKKKINDSKCCN